MKGGVKMYAYKEHSRKENASTGGIQKHFIIQRCAVIQKMNEVPGEHYASPDKSGDVNVELCDLSLVVSSNEGIRDMVLERPEVTVQLLRAMRAGEEIPPIALYYSNYGIRDGRHRVQAAIQNGYKRIPCIYVDDHGKPMDLPEEK